MSKKLVKMSKNVRFLSTFFAPPCANCSKRTIRSFEFLVLSFELNIAVDVVFLTNQKDYEPFSAANSMAAVCGVWR